MPEYVPVISLVNPIQGMSYYGYNSFIGCTASNVKLSQLDDYLKASFENTDRNVFIIEKSSGYLIASSLGAKTYVSINGVNVS